MNEKDAAGKSQSSVLSTMLKVLGAAMLSGVLVMIGIITFYTPDTEAQRYVQSDKEAFPRLKYADSLVSVNDRCIVAQRKLNKGIDPYYVNGKPIGFC